MSHGMRKKSVRKTKRWRFSLRFKIKGRMQKWSSTLWCRMSDIVVFHFANLPFNVRFPRVSTRFHSWPPWHPMAPAPQGEELLSEAQDLPRGPSRKSSVALMEGLHRLIWSLPEECTTDWWSTCGSLPSAKQPLPNKKIQLQTGIYISFETSLQEGRAKVWTSSTTLQTCPIDLERSVDFGSSIPQVAPHGTAIFNHPASCLHITHTPGCLGQHMTQLLPETENS